jgi:hypothetical protein
MKITKSQLKQIIKEEIGFIAEGDGQASNMGGLAGGLGALGRAPQESPEDELDSQVQSRAMGFFMNLGLDEKTSGVFVNNIAIPDLQTVMEMVPKIDTAAEDDGPLREKEQHPNESCDQSHPDENHEEWEKQPLKISTPAIDPLSKTPKSRRFRIKGQRK